MRRRVLLTDLDNTWFNWVDFFGPSLRAMVHALAASLNRDEEAIYDELKDVYERYGTLEYKYAIQGLPLFAGADTEVREKALHAATVAFGRTRMNRLAAYDGAKETLTWLREQHVDVVAVTNSPVYETLGRLQSLRIAKYFSGLVGWAGAEEVAELLATRTESSTIKHVITLRDDELKPSPVAYQKAIDLICHSVGSDDVWAVGDSLNKDLEPAKALGVTTIWARYGREFEQKNFDTLLRVTHWSEERVHSTYVCDVFEPDHVIDSIGELRSIVPPTQPPLF